MQIIYTCPRCGHDLIAISTASIPPIHSMWCMACGWSSEGEREEIIRVPYGDNVYTMDIPKACITCPNHPSNGGGGICHCILGTQTIY